MNANKHIPAGQNEQDPILPFSKGANGFSTPSSYFDDLPTEIMGRIHSSEKKPVFFLKPAYSIATLSALTGIVFLFFFLNQEPATYDVELSENDIAHLVEYPELYNIDEELITETYLSSNIEGEDTDAGTDISEDDIRNYLEETSDVNTIINEY